MKKEITVKQVGTRVYLRSIDIPLLKPVLNLAGIQLKINTNFRHTHTPKYYISATDLFNFLQTARSTFIIKIL